MKIRLVTKCGCTKEIEGGAGVNHQVSFPDGSWRVFKLEGFAADGTRIFQEVDNFRISSKGKTKRWERWEH